MIRIIPLALAGFILAGCETMGDIADAAIGVALTSKEVAAKYAVKAAEKACDLPLGVRREALEIANDTLATRGSQIIIHPFLACNGGDKPDLL
jgi:hypothetical protein